MRNNIIGGILRVISTIFLIAVVLTLPLMWLWNNTVTELFSIPEIGFWMALKLNFLSSILFKASSTKK